MSDTDELYVAPDRSVTPQASVEVVQETYEPPTASIKASEQSRTSVETVRSGNPPEPSVETVKKGS